MAPTRNWLGTTTAWGATTNWSGTPAGIPTAVDDLIFGSTAPNCVVDVAAPACRSLDFTDYGATISINNNILIGTSTAITSGATAGFIHLGSSMGITGTGTITLRGMSNNPRYVFRSNGKFWPNNLGATAAFAASTPLYSFLDSWTIGGTFTIGNSLGSSQILTTSAGITCQGNLVTTGSASGGVIATTSTTKIALGGTCTWSSSPSASPAVQQHRNHFSIDINAGSSLVTIADGTSWGGAGTTASTLKYVSGNVLHQGTFYLQQAVGSTFCNLDLNGSSDPGATAFSSTGVNFNNLQIRMLSTTGTMTLVSPLRVVNLLSTAGVTGQGIKTVQSVLNGSTMYLGGSFSHTGGKLSGTTQAMFIGTGMWTEPNASLVTTSGIANSVSFNTSGTITLDGGIVIGGASTYMPTYTYTAGTVLATGATIFVAPGATFQTLQGFSNFDIGNLYIGGLSDMGEWGGSNRLYACNLIDTKPVNVIGTVGATNIGSINSARFAGNIGFTASSFNVILPSTSTYNGTLSPYKFIGFQGGVTYYIKNSMVVRGDATTFMGPVLRSNSSSQYTYINLSPGATQDLFIASPSRLDASGGQALKFNLGNVATFYGIIGWSTTTVVNTDLRSEISRTLITNGRILYPSWSVGSTAQVLASRNVLIQNNTLDIPKSYIIE
jgi:hypothetical protein